MKSVRAATGSWDPARPTEGAYSALLTFEDGAYASVVYSGYARFDSDEFCGWIGEQGQQKDPARHAMARGMLHRAATADKETALKNSRNYGGAEYAQPAGASPPLHQHFGLVLVSCERADLRPLPTGVVVYGDSGPQLEALPAPQVPRAEVIDELYEAIVSGRPPLHDGAWALATLEVCLAILQSAREQSEVLLEHQVALPG